MRHVRLARRSDGGASRQRDTLPHHEGLTVNLGGQTIDERTDITVWLQGQGDRPERVAGLHHPSVRSNGSWSTSRGAAGGEGTTGAASEGRLQGEQDASERDQQANQQCRSHALRGGRLPGRRQAQVVLSVTSQYSSHRYLLSRILERLFVSKQNVCSAVKVDRTDVCSPECSQLASSGMTGKQGPTETVVPTAGPGLLHGSVSVRSTPAGPGPGRDLTGKRREILEFIARQIEQRGYPPTVREIGEAVGLTSSSTVHTHLTTLQRQGYLRRDPTKPRAIEVRYQASSGEAVERRPVRHVPLLGDVAAGTDVLAQENVEELLPLPEDFCGDGPVFMLRVRGDSMIEAGILDGDLVTVRQQAEVAPGDIVVVGIPGGEATVKTWQRDGDSVVLVPSNSNLQPMVFAPEEVSVFGRVVNVLRRL